MLCKTDGMPGSSRERTSQDLDLDPGTPIEVVPAGTSATNDQSGIDKTQPVVVQPPPGP